MKFYNTLIRYRFALGLLAIALAVLITIKAGFWAAFILYFIGLIALFSHFFIGPLRLVQEPMEQGNTEEVEKILATIKFPGLLYKPVRSTYYTLKGNFFYKKEFSPSSSKIEKSLILISL